MNMKQDEINVREWNNPENWARPRWLGLYFSKNDSRPWVPKYPRALGWTVNLAQPRGALLFLSIIVAAVLIAALAARLAGA